MNSFSMGINFVLGLVSVRVIAQFLGPSGMALVGNFRNFSGLFKSLVTVGINASIVKLFVENQQDKSELSKIYSTFLWIFLGFSMVLGILVMLFSSYLSLFLLGSSAYAYTIQLFGVLLPLFVLNTFWIAVYNGLQQFRKIVVIQILSSVFIFLLTLGLIYLKKLEGALLAAAIGEGLMTVITLLFVLNNKEYFSFDFQKIISKKHLKVIGKFSVMSLLSAIIVPLTLIAIRKLISETISIEGAGIWDAVNRISGFYMMFFTSGLSLYYMPRLTELKTEREFTAELRYYFRTLVPLFLAVVVGIYLFRSPLIDLALTSKFAAAKDLVFWQLAGDFVRILSLAFGYQILVKLMMKQYFTVEIVFNLSYYLLAWLLIENDMLSGAVKAYFFANLIALAIMLFVFRNLLLDRSGKTSP